MVGKQEIKRKITGYLIKRNRRESDHYIWYTSHPYKRLNIFGTTINHNLPRELWATTRLIAVGRVSYLKSSGGLIAEVGKQLSLCAS